MNIKLIYNSFHRITFYFNEHTIYNDLNKVSIQQFKK